MTDIVERLRMSHLPNDWDMRQEAAAEIERLRTRCYELEQFIFTPEAKSIRAATIEECAIAAKLWMHRHGYDPVPIMAAIRAIKEKS